MVWRPERPNSQRWLLAGLLLCSADVSLAQIQPIGGTGPNRALTFLPGDHPIVPQVTRAVHRGMAFMLRAQWPDGQHAGGIPMAIEWLPDDGRPETARFNANATEIRIDYVQHALSAMLQYRQLGLAASR